MVVAAQIESISQAHPNLADPAWPGRDGRSSTRVPDPQGPGSSATDGGEDPGLYGPDRTGAGRSAPPPPSPQSPPLTDSATALAQSVRAGFADFDGFLLEEMRSRRWASVTFRGARHELVFRLEGERAEQAAARFLASLEPRNFPLRGHLVADLSLVSQERRPGWARIRLEALTVEDR